MLVGILLATFALGAAAPLLERRLGRPAAWALAAWPALLLAWLLTRAGPVGRGDVLAQTLPWVPPAGIDLALRLDGLSLLFSVIVAAVGVPVLVHTGGYLAGHPRRGEALGWLIAFMGAMLGLLWSDDLVSLFVFWELTSVASWMLIGFEHGEREARRSALRALLVTSAGAQAMLAGLLLLAGMAGSDRLSELTLQGTLLQQHPLYPAALLLILAGAFTKSAQVPFHGWLPAAMVAPTPVSAYLHAATMVKAGVYLLARLQPALGDTPLWRTVLVTVGVTTLAVGGVRAASGRDIKRVLAHGTVSVLGLLVLLVGVGTRAALVGMGAYVLAHAAYKGALFLAAGNVSHATGTRDLTALRGLARVLPWTAAAAALAALSMAGVPPLLGFGGKSAIYASLLGPQPSWLWASVAAALAFVAAAALLAGVRPFLGPRRAPREVATTPPGMALAAGLLALAGLGLGLAPALVEPLVAAAVDVVRPGSTATLHAWPSLGPALAVEGGSLAAGVILFLAWPWLGSSAASLASGARAPLETLAEGLGRVAAFGRDAVTRAGTAGLGAHVTLTTVAAVGLLGAAAWWGGAYPPASIGTGGAAFDVVGGVVIVVAVLGILRARRLVSLVVGLGAVGFAVALVFVRYGAPDVALAQFLAETLTAIIFVLVFRRLEGLRPTPRARRRLARAALALVAGAGAGLLVLLTGSRSPATISAYFLRNAASEGHGRNVVNVILTDFRALDTLGEITVLATAAAAATLLLAGGLRSKESP